MCKARSQDRIISRRLAGCGRVCAFACRREKQLVEADATLSAPGLAVTRRQELVVRSSPSPPFAERRLPGREGAAAAFVMVRWVCVRSRHSPMDSCSIPFITHSFNRKRPIEGASDDQRPVGANCQGSRSA